MQDRFKFRCWDDYNREMLDLQEQDTNPYNICDFTQNNIMQCTGLKDKNGKLIYEGDIVKIPNSWHSYQINGTNIREIYYKEGAFRLKPINDKRNKNGFGYVLEKCNDFEIIGNIYQNPELLED